MMLTPLTYELEQALGSEDIEWMYFNSCYITLLISFEHIRKIMDSHNFKFILDHLAMTRKAIHN